MHIKLFLKNLATPILFVFLSVSCGISLSKTSSYKLDKLAYQISDYNQPYNNKNCSYVKLKTVDQKKQHNFLKPLYNFFQNASNRNFIYDFRQYCDNSIFYKTESNDNINLSFYSQSNFDIRKKNKNYIVDGQQFCSFYMDNVLGPRGYLKVRGGCDSFIFISDKFADILIKNYGLENYEHPYEELIKNKKYYVLKVKIDDKKELRFCINNILYTNKGTAPRYCQFNENFGLIKINENIKPNFNIAFELDFKFSASCITSTLNHTSSLGYGINDYRYEFYKNNPVTKKYYFDEVITNEFKNISSSMDVLYITLFILILIVGTFILILFVRKMQFDSFSPLLNIIVFCSLLLIYSLVSAFMYVYAFFAICPIYLTMVYAILRHKEI